MDLKDKKVLVIGTGISGKGAAKLLMEAGAHITLYDSNENIDGEAVLSELGGENAIRLIKGAMPDGMTGETDLLVISPGVPKESETVLAFEEKNIPVWGEIELAYNFEKGTVYAVTGTNGKTTTTTLLGEIMKKYNPNTFVVGNIGNSYTGEVLKTDADSITVAEISSFQLETTVDFAPRGTAILNITPDHLDRHHTMENYAAVKESITKNQFKDGKNDFCVLNYDDVILRKFGETIKNPVYFSRKNIPPRGAYLEKNMIKYTDGNKVCDIIRTDDMHLFGSHNYENVMAAAAVAIEAGVPLEIIVDTVRNFKGVEHRIEHVLDKDGVIYYNDSKGTNPDSSIKALEAMSRPTVLIAGGYDKHSEFDEFIEAFGGKVKLMVLIGQTAAKIEETAKKHGFFNTVHAKDLEEAVKICHENAVSGDAVLLSPACASWGMFKNYEERGRLFKEYVRQL